MGAGGGTERGNRDNRPLRRGEAPSSLNFARAALLAALFATAAPTQRAGDKRGGRRYKVRLLTIFRLTCHVVTPHVTPSPAETQAKLELESTGLEPLTALLDSANCLLTA